MIFYLFILGEGEWQCIIGTHFGASLTFDTHCLSLIDFPEFRKSVMLFRSGWEIGFYILYSFEIVILLRHLISFHQIFLKEKYESLKQLNRRRADFHPKVSIFKIKMKILVLYLIDFVALRKRHISIHLPLYRTIPWI